MARTIQPPAHAKLRPPRPLMRRRSLEQRLTAAADEAVLVLVQAPAGTGKTSDRVGDRAGTSPGVAHRRSARRRPGAVLVAGRDGSRRGGRDDAAVWSDLFVSALAERIVQHQRRPVLVLDEYEQLSRRLRACGDALTTVVASRVRPPLRLDRPAFAARLVVLRWPQLRMDVDEAGE